MIKKRFGQHFLADRSILERIVRFAAIAPEDTVLEIGPGRGALTRELAGKAHRVIAIEVDRDLLPLLRSNAPDNVAVVEGDALIAAFPAEPFHIVANLPYNIATPLLKRFIGERSRIQSVTVMVQAEVGERIAAAPSTAAYGPLSVLMQYYANVTRGFLIRPGAFQPPPKVDSIVIRLNWKADVPDNTAFTDFVHRAFLERRKKLLNNLERICPQRNRPQILAALEECGVDPNARPETVTIDGFLRVYNRLR